VIVLTAETIVPPPMHRLRLVREDIKNAKLAGDKARSPVVAEERKPLTP
jgi:hypothetical protein